MTPVKNGGITLPRLKNQAVLTKSVQAAISQLTHGPFAYAEKWDESSGKYLGLAIEKATNAMVVIDGDAVIIKPEVAEANRPEPKESVVPASGGAGTVVSGDPGSTVDGSEKPDIGEDKPEPLPTRFIGTVMISPERPAREIHQIVEAVIEQLTTIKGASVEIKLEIDAEIPSGIDKNKSRTLLENANTLNFIDKELL